MKHITSKLLSLLLTLAMLLSMIPAAYAEGTEGTTEGSTSTEKVVAEVGETTATTETLNGSTTVTSSNAATAVGDGSENNPYTPEQLSKMTRDAYIEAQTRLGGTMYVTVGDYSYKKDGVLGNGERNDKPGQTENRDVLNGYNSNGYLGKKNDGANGKNIVFVGGSITSGATGYTSIDNIGTSLLLAVPAYTNVTFEGITFNNVMSFDYQLYTGPWSQLGELKFDGCTFNGIIVGAIAAQTLTFNGCTFNNYENTDSANNSNPTWIRPAYGNWKKDDNEGQGDNFKSLTTINFTGNTVTSTRPVKFEYISQWDITSTVTATGNHFDISAQAADKPTEIKNVGLYLGAHTDENEFHLVADNNTKSKGTAALYTIPKGTTSLPAGSTVKDSNGNDTQLTDALKWKGGSGDVLTLKTAYTEAAVAGINGVSYDSLAKAIATAKDGDTVKLLKSCNGNGIKIETQAFNDKGLTVDFGGNTYTVGGVLVGSTGTGTNAFQLLKDNKVTFQNGEIVGVTEGTKPAEDTPGWHGAPAIMIQNYCDLTLKNMTVTGGDETVYTMSNNHGDVVIEDSTITAGKAKGYSSPAIAFDVCGYSTYTGVSVTVKGSSVIEGDIEVSRSATNTNDVKLALESGTISGGLKIDSSIKSGDATAITKTENVSLTPPNGYIWTKVGNTGVLVKEDSAAVVNGVGYATLADALDAVKNGGTITLLQNTNLEDAEYYINKPVTINGSGKISCTVKSGEATRAFVVENNGSLTLDGVELDIQGTKNSDTKKNNDGTGIDVQFGGKLVLQNQAVLKLHDLERGTIFSEPEGTTAKPGQVVINNSTFNSTDIDGNASNGGDWKVTNGSTVNIDNCGSYGLSVDSLTTEQSTVNVSGTGYSAIYGKNLQFKNGSNVLISGAGTKLPLQSQWSDARSPIQTDKNGGTIVVDSGAVVTVQNCENKEGKANNTIYLPKNTTYMNNGTVNATIITDTAPEGSCVVTLVSDGKTIGVQTVSKDFKFALPEAPAKNNYTFKGWSDGSATYKVGDEAVITKDTTFTALWSYNGSSSGGGSSSSSRRYDVSTPSVKHGDVTVSPKSASKGDTVTITVKPDSGYELDTLTVKDASGSKIKVKDKGDGKFTFTMPASKVTVSAEFAEIETLDFADVSTDAYYYEAVKWAAKKGITGGTGDGNFNPNGSCTRAHIVTFLWRAAGSPEPKSTVSFADVPAGSYYAKAVAWAVENGITLGAGDGTFSPNATCTRAQSVTFLYRALGTAPTTVNGFTDVTADAFYADAVAWAVESGVTNGTSASTFSPNNGCTRAQIVTFLFRAYQGK